MKNLIFNKFIKPIYKYFNNQMSRNLYVFYKNENDVNYDSDFDNERFTSINSTIFIQNDLLEELSLQYQNIEFTKKMVKKIIKEMSDKLETGHNDKYIGEIIMFFGYLLRNNTFPIWIKYN